MADPKTTNATNGPGSGSAGFLAAENFDYDAYFQENAGALDDPNARHDIKSQIFFGDLGKGFEQSGGAMGGIVGVALGALYGLVDGIAFDAAIDASIDEARGRAREIEEEVDQIMNFRANIENKLAQFTTPQEQALRERSKLYGLQIRAQGLSGTQALAAQQIAERQYRNVVGAQLPEAITVASREARAGALARIQAVETKFGLILANERQQLLEDIQIGELQGAASGAIQTGLGKAAQGVGSVIENMIDGQGKAVDPSVAATAGKAGNQGAVPAPPDPGVAGAGDAFAGSGSPFDDGVVV